MANDIALQPFQGPSGVGSYLSSYAQAQQVAQQRDAAERQKVIAGRQDEQYAREKQMQAIDALGGALDTIQDGDAQGFERVKGWAVQNGLIDANEAQRYTVEQLPQIRALSQQARAMIKERQAATLGQQKFALEQRIGEANIRQSDAAAAASRASAARVGSGGGFDNTTFDNVSSLRKEFVGATKDFGQVRDAYGRIQASAKDPSPAGDLALIFNYMKVLDPGSTVREGEFATAQNSTGVPEQIINLYNRVKSGERLNPTQRADFVNRAGQLFNKQQEIYKTTVNNYSGLATRFGFDPSLVVIDQTGGMSGPGAEPTVTAPPSFTSGTGVFTNRPLQASPQSALDAADAIVGIKR